MKSMFVVVCSVVLVYCGLVVLRRVKVDADVENV